MQLDRPEQVRVWLLAIIEERRRDIVETWESAETPTERERLHVALLEADFLKEYCLARIPKSGDGRE